MTEYFSAGVPISATLLQPGPNWDYPNWTRDVNGKPVAPLDGVARLDASGKPASVNGTGEPVKYTRGVTGELYRIEGALAYPLDSGVAMIFPPVIP